MTRSRATATPRGGGHGFWLALVLLVVVLALLAVVLAWYLSRGRGAAQAVVEPRAGEQQVTASVRGAILVFLSPDGRRHLTEQRQLPARDLFELEVRDVLDALVAGPSRSDAFSPLPPGSRLLSVFHDPQRGALVLDWSGDLLTGLPGGSSLEEAVLDVVLRTVALNFPRLRHCTLLVEGAPVTTLGGHLALDRPFDLAEWR